MKIIRSYILKDFLSISLFSFLIIGMAILMGTMIPITDMIVRKGVGFFDAMKIFSYQAPVQLKYIIPISFLFGVLLVMGRLVSDNELTAIRVAGIPLIKILNIFLVVGIIFTLLLFIINDRLVPELHYQYQKSKKTFLYKNVSALIEPDEFLDHFDNYVLYVSDKYDENKLKNVFIYEVSDQKGANKVIFAKRGEFIRDGEVLKIKLEDGFRDESSPEKQELYRLNFKVFFMDIPIQDKENKVIRKKPVEMSIKELQEKINYLKNLGVDLPYEPMELRKELLERTSYPFSIIVFILLGFGVSLVVRHREKSINFLIAIVGYGLYYLLGMAGTTLIEHQLIIPWLGMWLPNIIIGLLGIFLFLKHANSG
ncbi:MAG: LptF/LptG family permease [Candidatus Omnitrophica bacterium]|nr:LptF/LptG family permease [Candidatus Omnitrophota bacterium]